MPYRHAHWWVLALVPVILLAFWPAYFGSLRGASFAFHAHGVTASAWILLVAGQSWTIAARRNRWHRLLGLALFGLVPLFAGAAVLGVHSMAVKFATASHPFYVMLGPRLGLHDVVSTTTLVALVATALRHRRNAALHGGYMLATVILVLPPIAPRLPLPIPGWIHPGEIAALAIALVAAARTRRARAPFLIVAGVMLLQVALFHTLGASAAWASAFRGYSTVAVTPWALAAMAAAGLALAAGWLTRRPVRAIQPAA